MMLQYDTLRYGQETAIRLADRVAFDLDWIMDGLYASIKDPEVAKGSRGLFDGFRFESGDSS